MRYSRTQNLIQCLYLFNTKFCINQLQCGPAFISFFTALIASKPYSLHFFIIFHHHIIGTRDECVFYA